jgi:hypothetical protein
MLALNNMLHTCTSFVQHPPWFRTCQCTKPVQMCDLCVYFSRSDRRHSRRRRYSVALKTQPCEKTLLGKNAHMGREKLYRYFTASVFSPVNLRVDSNFSLARDFVRISAGFSVPGINRSSTSPSNIFRAHNDNEYQYVLSTAPLCCFGL